MGHNRCCSLVKGYPVQTTDNVRTNPEDRELVVMPSPSIWSRNGTRTTHTAFGTCVYHVHQWQSISLHICEICYETPKYTEQCRYQPRKLFRTFFSTWGSHIRHESGVSLPPHQVSRRLGKRCV